MTDRPKRRAIPMRVRRQKIAEQKTCPCGCGLELTERMPTQWDHEPALSLRDVNRRRTDYIPRQHDPAYIVGRCKPSHDAKTRGNGATTAGTDIGKWRKEQKRNRPPKFKRPTPSQKLKGRSNWPKRGTQKIQSRGWKNG